MDNATVQKLKETIAKSANIGVVIGQNPTIDEMGAALSLYLSLKQAKKNISIASPSEPIVEVSSLVGINKVQTALGGEAGDLVVSFPYEEGEIEKVSYTIENGYLNIIVKVDQAGLSFEDKDVKYSRGSGAVDLLFVIGTPRLSDLTGVIDSQKLGDVKIINIDNKKENQGFGDIVLVSPEFSSVSEQVGDVILSLGLAVDQDVAQNLLSGITFATQNFQDPRTSALAFEIAALLLKKGAARVRTERPERLPHRSENRPQQENRQSQNNNQNHAQSQAPRPQQRQQPQEENRPQRPPVQNHPQPQRQQPQEEHRPQRPPVQNQQQERPQERRQSIQDDLKQEETVSDEQPPVDWLSPKVYKGSSNF